MAQPERAGGKPTTTGAGHCRRDQGSASTLFLPAVTTRMVCVVGFVPFDTSVVSLAPVIGRASAMHMATSGCGGGNAFLTCGAGNGWPASTTTGSMNTTSNATIMVASKIPRILLSSS